MTATATIDSMPALERDLAPLRDTLVAHPIYARLTDPDCLRVFMGNHAFAVWDFMSLLKSLQRRLTGIGVPWLPVENTPAARVVNEIVLGEETDQVAPGCYASHFDLYLDAMGEIGADTRPIRRFLAALREGLPPLRALARVSVPEETRKFVETTLRFCEADIVESAAAFLLGRERFQPARYQPVLAALDAAGIACDGYRLYLERHLLLAGGPPEPVARRLLEALCTTDTARWQAAATAARQALEARKALWDGVLRAMG